MNNKSIKEFVLSDENIAFAIYTVDSYVANKAFFCEADKELLYNLKDIYNEKLIKETIGLVRDKLSNILDDKKYYFEANVLFKPKKYDEKDGPVYRPIHTTDLISQIAIVSLLHVLVYRFDNNKISYSELTQLIPDNFYGNKISTNGHHLFKPWKEQYAEYNKKVNESIMEYKETLEYKYIVTLDLKQFFPSVSPRMIEKYLKDNIPVYYSDSDKETIMIIIKKLVHIKLANYDKLNNFEKKQYLYNIKKDKYLPKKLDFCVGIPQGLPHSYFFANFIMISVADIYKKHFKGSMFFYVDDSSIFTNEINNDFEKIIEDINLELKNIQSEEINTYEGIVYKIEVHTKDKSYYEEIKDVNINFADLSRETSKASFDINTIFSDDEVEALHFRYTKLLDYIQEKLDKIDESQDKNFQIQHKKLTQYKKFYKYRVLKLELILNKLNIKKVKNINDIKKILYAKDDNISDVECIFNLCTDDILITWLNEVFRNVEKEQEDRFKDYFKEIVKLLCNEEDNNKINQESLITSYELGVCVNNSNKCHKNKIINIPDDCDKNNIKYYTLDKKIKEHCKELNRYVWKEKISYIKNKILSKLNKEKFIYYGIMKNIGMKNFVKYGKIIYNNSNAIYINFLNALFSYFFNIYTSEKFVFSKKNDRLLNYTELRILSLVRNRNIKRNDLINKLESIISSEEVEVIDYSILDVIEKFRKFVSNPLYIDNLILIHKFCTDTWKNGSIYLNFYTMHNQEHAVSLINISINIIKKISKLQLKKNEYFTLFASCYLHDISMVTVPDMLELLNDKECCNTIADDLLKDNEIKTLIQNMLKLLNDNERCNTIADNLLKDNEIKTLIQNILKLLNDKESFNTIADELFKNKKIKTFLQENNIEDIKNIYSKKVCSNLIRIHNIVYTKISDYARNVHHKKSAEEICKHNELSFLEDSLRYNIAKSSEAHCEYADIVYGFTLKKDKNDKESAETKKTSELVKSEDLNNSEVENNRILKNKKLCFDEKKTKIMLRFADLLDINRYRVSRVVFNHNFDNFDRETKFHWISHLLTEDCNINVSYSDGYNDNTIRENIELNISVNFNQKTPISKKENYGCKYVSSTKVDENTLTYIFEKEKDVEITEKCSGKCNILCSWFILKNKYLFQEIAYLQEYLSNNNYIFDTNFTIKLNFTGYSNVVNSEMESNIIKYVNEEQNKK